MDNRRGKGKRNDDDGRKIDLTLKLGPSVEYNQTEEDEEEDSTSRGMHGYSSAVYQSSNDTGNWNVEYSNPSGAYWTQEAGPTNYMVYQGGLPYNVSTSDRKRNVDDGKACKACGSNSTPLWRKGPDGPQTLCNACGLRHLRTVKKGGE